MVSLAKDMSCKTGARVIVFEFVVSPPCFLCLHLSCHMQSKCGEIGAGVKLGSIHDDVLCICHEY